MILCRLRAALVTDIRHGPYAYAAESISTREAVVSHGKIAGYIEFMKLLINPLEAAYQALVVLLEESGLMIQAINQCQRSEKELGGLAVMITEKAQVVLKREWEQVKTGE